MADLLELTADNFDAEVLQSQEPVLVDFWGPTCPPCRAIAPVVEQLAADNAGAIKVAKLNVETNMELAGRYKIYNIPTLMIFKGGEVFQSLMGLQPKERLQEMIDQATA